MPQIHFGEAFRLLSRTAPFLVARLGAYLLLGLALGVYAAVVGGVAFLLGKLWAPLGVILFLVMIGGAWAIVSWAGRYGLYLLKAAHTAVMTELLVTGNLPAGSQVAWGKDRVQERFGQTSAMFAVDQLLDGVVKAVTRSVARVADLLPIPGLDGLTKLLQGVARASTTYIDEAILSRAYAKREQNVYAVAHEGVVLYAQAWKPILFNAVALTLLGVVEVLLWILLLSLPALALGALFPDLGVALGFGVLIGAWMLKLAVSDAFALAVTLSAYHHATRGVEADPTWTRRLESISDKFVELGRKAREAVATPRGAPAPEGAEGLEPAPPAAPPVTPPAATAPAAAPAPAGATTASTVDFDPRA